MIRYHCSLFEGRGNPNHYMQAHFRLMFVPPRMEFVLHDRTKWLTWSIENQAFNSQGRTRLASLRPRDAWIMQRGVN